MGAYLAGWLMGVFDVLGLQTLIGVIALLAWRRRRATPAPTQRYTFSMPTIDANEDEPPRRIPDAW